MIATALGIALLFAFAVPAAAVPTPAQKLKTARAEAKRVQAVVADMDARLEGVVESYNKVKEDLDKTDREIIVTRQRLEVAEAKYERAQAILNRRVTNIYRAGEMDYLAVVLGTNDFEDFVARLDLLARIGKQDAVLKVELGRTKAEIESLERALEQKRARQIQLKSELAYTRDSIQSRLEAKQRYLAGLNQTIQRLIEEERERQRKLAEIRAREALGGAKPSWYPTPDQIYPRDKLVDIALSRLGMRYQWGATGPNEFDCSGLMLWSYAHVGVYLPRVSQDQSRVGVQLEKSELQPGDLVYFGYGASKDRVHHIGMYLGEDRFLHAPGSGDHVKISALSERSDYAGACRP
jgi:cell wall-associated NlpC family hydrolase